MQASDRILASRYGKALFLAAVAGRKAPRVQKDLELAHRELLILSAFLRQPQVSASDKKKKIRETLKDKAQSLVVDFLALLIDKKRFELLPLIIAHYGQLVAEENKMVQAHVRVARPLSDAARGALQEKLKNFTGKVVELDVKEDSELIGGAIVRLGDWVLDSSLRGQLRALREAISNGH